MVDAGLAEAGCRRIIPMGRGDDAGNDLESTFDSWVTSLAVAIEVGTESVTVTTNEEEYLAKTFDAQLKNLRSFLDLEVSGGDKFFDNGLSTDARRSTFHVELAATDRKAIEYEAGDHLALLPVSDEQAMMYATQRLGLQEDEVRRSKCSLPHPNLHLYP